MFDTQLSERDAYRALFAFGGVLSGLDTDQVSNIAAAILTQGYLRMRLWPCSRPKCRLPEQVHRSVLERNSLYFSLLAGNAGEGFAPDCVLRQTFQELATRINTIESSCQPRELLARRLTAHSSNRHHVV